MGIDCLVLEAVEFKFKVDFLRNSTVFKKPTYSTTPRTEFRLLGNMKDR